MSPVEYVVLVDEQNRELGQEEKLLAHRLGNLHRAFSVFIFRSHNSRIQLLLQQRNQAKYHCGNLWTNTCCGHPPSGEDIVVAAQRRLQEEMHFVATLEYLDRFHYFAKCNNDLIEHELDHVLIGRYQQEIISVNAAEVQDFRWIELIALEQELMQFPATFTPWFAEALAVVKQHWSKVEGLFAHTACKQSVENNV